MMWRFVRYLQEHYGGPLTILIVVMIFALVFFIGVLVSIYTSGD